MAGRQRIELPGELLLLSGEAGAVATVSNAGGSDSRIVLERGGRTRRTFGGEPNRGGVASWLLLPPGAV